MNKLILIGIGSGIGGICRYGLSNVVHLKMSKMFPFGTLLVNLSGCFLMGILFVLLLERWDGFSDQWRALLLVGFLGGFTTFSSFSIETILLFEEGQWLWGSMNVLMSVVGCLLMTGLGVVLGRQ